MHLTRAFQKSSLRRTSSDFSSHAYHTRFAFSSRVSYQKLLTKPRVCIMIFPASERGSYRSNWILRGIAQLVEQRSPSGNHDLIFRIITGFLRLETSVSSLFSCFDFCKPVNQFMQNWGQNLQKSRNSINRSALFQQQKKGWLILFWVSLFCRLHLFCLIDNHCGNKL